MAGHDAESVVAVGLVTVTTGRPRSRSVAVALGLHEPGVPDTTARTLPKYCVLIVKPVMVCWLLLSAVQENCCVLSADQTCRSYVAPLTMVQVAPNCWVRNCSVPGT